MFKKITLKNGLRLVVVPKSDTKVVTVFVLIGVGSRYETKSVQGLAHFIEHMMFKGTKKRPTALHLTRDIEGMGGAPSAFTSRDMTAYTIKVNSANAEKATEILSDMLCNSRLDVEEIEREKGVIVEEENMRHDNPLIHIGDLFDNTLFGDQPIGRDPGGEKGSVRRMQRKNFASFLKRFYTTGNTVIGMAGDIDPKQAEKLANKYFACLKSGTRSLPKRASLKPTFSKVRIAHRQSEQSHIALGFPGFSYKNPNRPTLEILNVILGANMSSRLFSVIREKHGMAYYIRSHIDYLAETGTYSVMAGLDTKRITKALRLIVKELYRLTKAPVGVAELKRAKEYLKGQLAIQMEDSEQLVFWLTRQTMMEGKIQTVEDKMAALDKVKPSEIRRVAKQIFRENKMNLAVIGPFADKDKFQKLLTFS